MVNSRLLALALGTFALGTDAFVIAGILPTIAHSFRVSAAQAGQLVAAFALVYAIATPVLATLTGKTDRRGLLIVALALFAAANGIAAMAPTLGFLLVVRIAAAGAAALYTPNALAVAAATAPPNKRGRALALVTAGLTVATIMGVPLGSWIGFHFGWRSTFGLVALLGLAAAAGVLAFFPAISTPPAIGLRARLAPLGQPPVLGILGLTVLSFTGGFAIYTYIALLLRHFTHLGGVGISAMLLVFGLAGVVGNWLGGYTADTKGPVPVLAASTIVLTSVFMLLPVAATWLPGAVLSLAAWGIGGWALVPAQQHRLVTFVPENPSIVLSLNASANYLGIGLGATLGGYILRHTLAPFSDLAWVSAGCEASGFVLLILTSFRLFKAGSHADMTRNEG